MWLIKHIVHNMWFKYTHAYIILFYIKSINENTKYKRTLWIIPNKKY